MKKVEFRCVTSKVARTGQAHIMRRQLNMTWYDPAEMITSEFHVHLWKLGVKKCMPLVDRRRHMRR